MDVKRNVPMGLFFALLCVSAPTMASAICTAQRFTSSTSANPNRVHSTDSSGCTGVTVTCVVTPTPIQDLINLTSTVPGNVIKVGVLVSGVVTDETCTETLSIRGEKSRLTLDGQGGDFGANGAVLIGASSDSATITVIGNGNLITGFSSIKGGSNGVNVREGGQALITRNTIEENANTGITINAGGSARIGFTSVNNPPGAGNIIRNNGQQNGIPTCATRTSTGCSGILVSRGSSATIVGNFIVGNIGSGVSVSRVSQADIAGNTINSNGADGIDVASNSGVSLGNTTGTTQFDLPNTSTSNNTGFGFRCSSNSFADGRLSTTAITPISGASGATNVSPTCVNTLLP